MMAKIHPSYVPGPIVYSVYYTLYTIHCILYTAYYTGGFYWSNEKLKIIFKCTSEFK